MCHKQQEIINKKTRKLPNNQMQEVNPVQLQLQQSKHQLTTDVALGDLDQVELQV
jgi:hypothetical protein